MSCLLSHFDKKIHNTFLSREAEKTLRLSAGLSVLQSAYDGSSKADIFLPLQETPARSTFLLFSQRGGGSHGHVMAAANIPASSSATVLSARLAAPLPKLSSHCLHTLQPKILWEKVRQMEDDYKTAVRQFYCRPPPSSLGLQSGAPAQPTPGLQSSAAAEQPTPGLQNAAAVQPKSCLQSAAIVQPKSASTSSTRCRGRRKRDASAQVIGGPGDTSAPAQGTEGLGDASAPAHATEGPGDTSAQVIRGPGDTSAPAQGTEGLGDASAPAHATEGPGDTSAQVIRGPGDASAPAQATEGLGDTSASAHATEGRGDASAPGQATEGPCDPSAPVHATEGLGDASAPAHSTEGVGDPFASAPGLKAFQGFSKRLVLVLVPEPCDEGFEDEPPPEPVPERFKKELILVLASEPRDEGFEEEATPDPVSEEFKEQLVLVLASEGPPGSASVSEGLPGSASASEGSPGSAPASEGSPGSPTLLGRPPDRGSSTLLSRPPDRGSSTLLGQPPDRQFLHWRPLRSLRPCWPPCLRHPRRPPRSLMASLSSPSPPLQVAMVSTSLLALVFAFAAGLHGVYASVGLHDFAGDCPGLFVAGPDARLTFLPARGDYLVARLTFLPVRGNVLVVRLNFVPARGYVLVPA
ncbi:hypothetical protein CRENBAI_013049 [Crenichthys baileyi]|uniref:Transmembrane protein n=1 Tax=Crenichthys baileyi TaxID=28760 RepID=A0AAV9SEN4_9TELE